MMPEKENYGCFRVSVYDGMEFSRHEERLVREIPLEICLNRRKVITIACAGVHVDELAVGFLRSEGLIRTGEEIADIKVSPDRMRVNIRTATGREPLKRVKEKTLASSGAPGFGRTMKMPKLSGKISLAPEAILDLMERFLKMAHIHEETGGTHAAALVREGEILAVREDIGRHNAIDMLGGYALLHELDCRETAVFRTGRVSAEIVRKAWLIGSPLICSLSVPTSQAVETAREAGMSLIGSIRRGRLKIYV
jgi:FdhD protein